MDKTHIRALAIDVMGDHDLQGWAFKFDNAKVRAGSCNFRTKTITLSAPLLTHWTEAAVMDVLLHEVAHALAGRDAGHGYAWRRVARQIGCSTDRCWTPSEDAPELPGKWIGVCPNGHTTSRQYHRLPTARRSCGTCYPRRFDARFEFRWIENPLVAA